MFRPRHALILAMLALSACATGPRPAAEAAAAPQTAAAPPPAATQPKPGSGQLPITPGSPAANQSFGQWLKGVAVEARANGVSNDTVVSAFKDLAPIPRVVELDQRQPEFKATLAQYLSSALKQGRIDKGRRLYAENKALLDQVEQRMGVDGRFIAAFWGVETDYGALTGGYPVIGALATLAYDGRRAAFFRNELIKALQILEAGHITPQAMTGSWAGAMGQGQFMPSSFMKFAVDFDGDGKRDIWSNRADVFGSIANYLAQNGWRRGEGWGLEVKVPKGFAANLEGLDVSKPVSEWAAMGVKPLKGKLPPGARDASIVMPPRSDGRAFLVTKNYRVIRSYNPSHFYAIAVGNLADLIITALPK